MKIALGSDHTGVDVRAKLREMLDRLGLDHEDFGCDTREAVDYPDYAMAVGRAVAEGKCDTGVLICGTGNGVGIAANKIRGVLAAVCHDEFTTEMARKHNHANVLCVGARVLSTEQILKLLEVWLQTEPEHGRHDRRVAKILRLEQESCSLQQT